LRIYWISVLFICAPVAALNSIRPRSRRRFGSSLLLKTKRNTQRFEYHSTMTSETPNASSSLQRKHVAIVGSGIAGLTAAWVLSRDSRFTVTLIESEATLGMDAHSFDMSSVQSDGSAGSTQRLDMPLRVFSESYYPNLTRLYSAAGVTFCPEDYCGSFIDTDGTCLLKYNNFLIGQFSFPWIFPRFFFQRKSLAIAVEYFRFMVVARRHTKEGSVWLRALETMTFGEYLQRGAYSDAFVHKFIVLPHLPPSLATSPFLRDADPQVPVARAICTCSAAAALAYPADIILAYLCKRTLRGVRRAVQGIHP
jgi:hypothetical protein